MERNEIEALKTNKDPPDRALILNLCINAT